VKKLFVLTPAAKKDIRDMLLDLSEDSPDAAHSYRERLYDGFQTLGRRFLESLSLS